jgi:hypothetical protein
MTDYKTKQCSKGHEYPSRYIECPTCQRDRKKEKDIFDITLPSNQVQRKRFENTYK